MAATARGLERRNIDDPSVLVSNACDLQCFAQSDRTTARSRPQCCEPEVRGASKLFGGAGRLVYLPATGPALLAMLVFPLAEEVGWRGFAYPRLQKRYGPLRATLRLGALWALWHTMMFLITGIGPTTFAIIVVYCLAASIVFTWFYHRPRGGLPLVILAHAGMHLNNSHQPLPAAIAPLTAHTIGLVAVATILVLGGRKTWSAAS